MLTRMLTSDQCQKKIPAITENRVESLSSRETINVLDFRVDGSTSDQLYLRFNYNTSSVYGKVIYSNITVTDSEALTSLGLPQFVRAQPPIKNNQGDNSQDLVGNYFYYDSALFQVRNILPGGRVRSLSVDQEDNISLEMSIGTVTNLVDQHN